jgi:quercetin dioxygenase-like cupin family protein
MPTLTTLHRAEFPGDGYISVLVQIEVSPGEFIGRHTHPGLEMTYLLEGEATLMVDGQPAQAMKPGAWFQVPAGVPHSVQNGDKVLRAMATYVVEKDKPLVSFE